uniref:Uncharacterized protein n=1 Tax=Arundo donax TaxID=35708 RepID=A0A0A8YK24_ARUDO
MLTYTCTLQHVYAYMGVHKLITHMRR